MYAYDTILSVQSEEDFPDALYAMLNCCNTWKLQVKVTNTKKIFFSRGKIRKILNFFFGPKLLDVVDNYTYLGEEFNFNSRFVLRHCINVLSLVEMECPLTLENSILRYLGADPCTTLYTLQKLIWHAPRSTGIQFSSLNSATPTCDLEGRYRTNLIVLFCTICNFYW